MLARFTFSVIVPKYGEKRWIVKVHNADLKTSQYLSSHENNMLKISH